ncbi:SDR family oxidoreductase [Duganella sp. Root1480D1]|uniref:SDR family oxidoreductase n=1 Tax=Duganella sp. Root1480D1 TaxID=1736471 RepID=UPI00070F4378|nr:SDR family oxidoreductase [Duganella sp. Root1480D1]KQZ32673.1 short-chain dehydrogenase [Duganella sp. Root1480D1]
MERVLIAGGSSGMGLALAERLLREGCVVTIVGRSTEKLADAQEKLPQLTTVAADITQEDQVASLFAQCGRFDHIACTAADIGGAYQLLPDTDVAVMRKAMDSKLLGPLLLAKYGAPFLSASGSITFTSGIAYCRPAARGSVVAAINGGLNSLTYALAIELAPLRVNAVSPGWVDSPIWEFVAGDAKAGMLEGMAKKLPLGRVGHVDDIADAICFLMRNRFTTGSVLHVDGGHRLV